MIAPTRILILIIVGDLHSIDSGCQEMSACNTRIAPLIEKITA